jgi:hypothetical protein
MEMSLIALLHGLSLALVLTAKILKMRDMSYKMFLRLGGIFCFAAGATRPKRHLRTTLRDSLAEVLKKQEGSRMRFSLRLRMNQNKSHYLPSHTQKS